MLLVFIFVDGFLRHFISKIAEISGGTSDEGRYSPDGTSCGGSYSLGGTSSGGSYPLDDTSGSTGNECHTSVQRFSRLLDNVTYTRLPVLPPGDRFHKCIYNATW